MHTFRSALFQGDELLQRIADDLPENGRRTRISRTQHRKDPAVRKVQQALLDWKPGVLPRFGADGDYGNETAGAVKRFKMEVLGSKSDVIDDVGPLSTRTLDEIRAEAEGSSPPQASVRVRRDIWDLGDDGDPWRDPAILAYALAVGAMQDLDSTNPGNGASWLSQAAIHEHRPGTVVAASMLPDQCQHGGWFFLPWHRMYLHRFEEIVRSHMDSASAQTWALPYWNYSDDPRRRVLPPAFRQPNLPASAGGGRNPLFVAERGSFPIRVNAGAPMSPAAVDLRGAMRPAQFTSRSSVASQSFGGGQTSFHHGSDGPSGPLEGTPHGAVHVSVGGLLPDGNPDGFMSHFGTAALDPIFWLHHCNIDRLWEVWRRGSNQGHGPGANPTSSSWLTQEFSFFGKDGNRVPTMKVAEVLDIEGQLGYTYSDLPGPQPASAQPDAQLRMASVSSDQPPEMIGATEETLTLTGQTQSTRMPVSAPLRPARSAVGSEEPQQVYLSIENIEGDRNPGLLYGVFVNLPEGESPQYENPHYAGALSFFGIESTGSEGQGGDEAPHPLRYDFDITPIVEKLKQEGRWDPDHLDVTFSAIEAPDEEIAQHDIPPVQIGRVSLYVE